MVVFKVALGVLSRDPALAERTMAQALAGEDTLVTWLKDARKDGRLQVKDADLAAKIFWAMASGTHFWPRMLQGPMDKKKVQLLKMEIIETFLDRYAQ